SVTRSTCGPRRSPGSDLRAWPNGRWPPTSRRASSNDCRSRRACVRSAPSVAKGTAVRRRRPSGTSSPAAEHARPAKFRRMVEPSPEAVIETRVLRRVFKTRNRQDLKRAIAGDVVRFSIAGDQQRALEVIKDQPFVREAKLENGSVLLYVDRCEVAMPAILRLLDGASLQLMTVELHRPSLDDVVVLALIGLIGLLTASIAYAVALAVRSED